MNALSSLLKGGTLAKTWRFEKVMWPRRWSAIKPEWIIVTHQLTRREKQQFYYWGLFFIPWESKMWKNKSRSMMQCVVAAINVLREEHQNQPRPEVGVGVAPAGLSNVQSPGWRLYLPAELHKTRTNIVTLLFPLWQSSTNTFLYHQILLPECTQILLMMVMFISNPCSCGEQMHAYYMSSCKMSGHSENTYF